MPCSIWPSGWRGEVSPREQLRPTRASEEILPGVHFFHLWANVTALRTEVGLVLVDTGSPAARERTFAAVRAWDARPLHSAIFRARTVYRRLDIDSRSGHTRACEC